MKEQFRLNLNAGDGIGIERSVDGENWSQDIYVNTGSAGSTAKLAVKLLYLFDDLESKITGDCPLGEDCPEDLIEKTCGKKCPVCWDRFFDKKVDELGK